MHTMLALPSTTLLREGAVFGDYDFLDVENCKCGGKARLVGPNLSNFKSQVECSRCKCRGPIKQNGIHAIEAWNKRARPTLTQGEEK